MNNALPLQAGDQNGTMTIDSASSRDERLLYRRDNFLGQLSWETILHILYREPTAMIYDCDFLRRMMMKKRKKRKFIW